MQLPSTPVGPNEKQLVFFSQMTGCVSENCKNYNLQFERVFSVPGDAAMLSSTLVSPEVFNFTSVPYNISWYDLGGREMSDQSGSFLVSGGTLWFLDLTMEDSGEYVSIVRTPSECFSQATKLVVEAPVPGECGRPRKAVQPLTNRVTDILNCPLKDYIGKLDSYNVSSSVAWYRGCERIVDGTGRYTYLDTARLKIDQVERNNNSSYTCTLSFTLGGAERSVSESITALVSENYFLVPEVHEPANEIIRAPFGDSFAAARRDNSALLACSGCVEESIPLARELTCCGPRGAPPPLARMWKQDAPIAGVWLERVLMIPELREEDFNINYTCLAQSSRGIPTGYFTLLPADPNSMVPIGAALGGGMVLFVVGVVAYYVFKLDVVLWFRRTFPVLYANTGLRVQILYCSSGLRARDRGVGPRDGDRPVDLKLCSLPAAVVDSVEENIQASRRLLLIYTAATFVGKRHAGSGNNNEVRPGGGEDGHPDGRQQLECVTAMHRALLERSLKVILVELEPISPAQLALFPESVRHLRKKQGAVRWWKNRSGGTSEDGETGGGGGAASLSPSSRFWKEMRYRMPVRGKRGAYPEKTALLSL
uniref:Zmp:0000000936 n=1 Tax=Gasterosteus aculeatus aculeatus TaxID=481459 RepID=G3N8T9_GASAC